jgi:iron complex outermembrane receptor protein
MRGAAIGAALALSLGAALPAAAEIAAIADLDAIDSVVVTAQLRRERLQEVPVSVKAFTARQIDDAGIRNTQDFINLTPNVAFDQSFTYRNSFLTIRGISQVNNADAPVTVVVDGVPQNNQKQARMELFDLERIEVLKGPQGALYGRNAIGGVINITTRAPVPGFEGLAELGAGSGNAQRAAAALNASNADGSLSVRLAAMGARADGTIGNAYLARKVDAVGHDSGARLRIAFTPMAGVRLEARAASTNFAGGATWDSLVRDANPNHIVDPASNLLGASNGDSQDISVQAQFEFAPATLTITSAYTALSERYRGDLDFSNPGDARGGLLGALPFQVGQGQDLRVRLLGQELRLASPANGALRWIAGLHSLRTVRTLETRAFIDIDGSLRQWDDLAKNIVRHMEDNDNRAGAAFAQADIDLGRASTLAGALRYDRDARQQTDPLGAGQRRHTYNAWQPKLTLSHRAGGQQLWYASVGSGFRSGGFNAPGQKDFGDERMATLELGTKSVLDDGKLVLNAAAFASRSRGFQFFYVDAVSAAQVISNIERVGIKGIEADLHWRPRAALDLEAGLGLTDSRIRSNRLEPATVGNYTPKASPWKLNLAAQYSAPLTERMQGFVRAEIEQRSARYWHPDNVAVSNGMSLLGARAGLRSASGKWSVAAFGRNLGDRRYYADYNSARYTGGAVDLGSLAPGRTLGAEARVNF